MSINLTEDEIQLLSPENIKLTTDELNAVMNKQGIRNQQLFAVMLKYYKIQMCFPSRHDSLVSFLSKPISSQLGSGILHFYELENQNRTLKRYKTQIRERLGFRESTDDDSVNFIAWLVNNILNKMPKDSELKASIRSYYQILKLEPFTEKQQERYLDSARNELENVLFGTINDALSNLDKNNIDLLLKTTDSKINLDPLKKGVSGVKLKNIQPSLNKLEILKKYRLPDDVIKKFSRKLFIKYYDRIMAYSPSHIDELSSSAKYAMVIIFCHIRTEILIDNLVVLFLKLIRKIQKKSENHVNNTVIKEIKRIEGKLNILHELASASLNNPNGIIKNTIYPKVNVETLKALIEDLSHRGNWYKEQIRIKMNSLYCHGNRNELLNLLAALNFDAEEEEEKKIVEAIEFIIHNRNLTDKQFQAKNVPSIIDIFSNTQIKTAIKSKSDINVICRADYELIVCEELSKKLNYKGIWVKKGYRYRAPNEDLPQDFESNKEKYYAELGLPINCKDFIKPLKLETSNSLTSLNKSIIANDKVNLSSKDGGHIKVSPSQAQETPKNILDLQHEIVKRWGNINLIDAFKETNIRTGFIRHLETVGKYSNLEENKLTTRLLLSLYAIGTNTGIKRISIANPDANETDLLYVKNRFVNPSNVRWAIREVINNILELRDSDIWGKVTTTVACDSKILDALRQNLMTEWHGRYKSHGVMVYWHVDTNALCIFAQSKTCNSSEVGSMLKGVLDHSTKMDVNAAYVDTHGQSTIGFGIGKLLGLEILPRLKNIHIQKLYTVSSEDKKKYENISAVLKEPIKWNLIETHYDEAVKHLVALKSGLVEPDVLIKRFSKNNYNHPVYKALCEIGKATKTIFLCKYLEKEDLRIEINSALNVVERLNSVMNFFFYGKLGKIYNNNPEEQELSILCLHLLQVSSVYINTLLIQNILSEPEWKNKLTEEDYRALNPIFIAHYNPYGTFHLDLTERLLIN